MTTESAIPAHPLKLTNGATVELANLIQFRGLLSKPHLGRSVGRFAKKHLRDLPRECKDPNEMADWSDEKFREVTIDERTRDALKALVRAAYEKGAANGTSGSADLCEVLGLVSEED